ncbi:hypothetical protein FJZ31_05180 [Candidatus Poribacteria bacterium]|nr:hypothetical protein [Candidatus Poribacteria bacterium]
MSRRCFLFLIIFSVNLPQATLAALIDLSITRPKIPEVSREGFTTSSQQLTIEGIVETSVSADVLVSVNTPAGTRNLAAMVDSLYSVIVDFEITSEIVAILLTPLHSGKYYFGPRKVIASFSIDGVNFGKELQLFFPLGVENNNKVIAEFSESISTRFVRLDMVEGWQSDKILIEKIEFLNKDQKVIQPRIQAISTLLGLKTQRSVNFVLTVLLNEGENRITVVAKLLAKNLPDKEAKEVSEVISLFYLPELISEKAVNGRFVLSDGYKAQVIIPVNALDERIKRLQIIPVDPAQELPDSYLANIRIAEGTSPVSIYRFEASRQGIFPAEATAYLEGQPPTLSVDGIYSPPSTWVTSLAPLPVKLTVDLLKPHTISQIVIYAEVEGQKSFAPQKAKILVSNDKKALFVEPDRYAVVEHTNFSDEVTKIPLPTFPIGQYVQLLIEESKQANIISINEVEFWDESSAKIVSYVTMTTVPLQRLATLQLSYDENDLMRAKVKNEKNLAFFAWYEGAKEWQFAGGAVDTQENTVTLQLNYLQKVALFETNTKEAIEVLWSYNPFSPDGNGIADTTWLILNLQEQLLETNPQIIVEIFDLTGKLISTLIDRDPVKSSSIRVQWDGKDKTGRIVDIGPYIYQIKLGSQVKNGVIVVAK